MRALLLLSILLAPTAAAAWSVELEPPARAAAGLPFLVGVCVAGAPPGVLVEARAVLDDEGPRYAPLAVADASGRACGDAEAAPPDAAGEARLVVRARPEGGAVKASAAATVRLERAGVAVVEADAPVEAGGVRVPARGGVALAPRFGEDAPLRIVAAWGAPFEAVELEARSATTLRGFTLGERALPAIEVSAGERVALGKAAPPGLRHAPFALPKDLTLRAAKLALDAHDGPRPGPGEVANDSASWRAGRTALAPLVVESEARIEAFATPDAGAAPVVGLIDSARREVLVEVYTLTSPEVAAALGRALARGASVRVLLEGAPAGGLPPEEGPLVAALVARGADVSFLRSAPGFPARYQTVHSKLVVVDRERALVSTDNLHASSFPAAPGAGSSRGFGVIAHDARLAAAIADVIEADLAPWPDVAPADVAALGPPAPLASAAVEPGPVAVFDEPWRATLVLSPDSPDALLAAMARAERSLDVEMLFVQPRFGAGESPFVEALVAAARRGVAVRLLMDGRFDEGENAAVAERLNALAAREGLALEARVDARPRTLHAKLVVFDGTSVYVGSMNWGEASMRKNREAGLLLEAPAVAAWAARAFEADGSEEVPRREAPGPAWPLVLSCLLLRGSRRRRGAGSRS